MSSASTTPPASMSPFLHRKGSEWGYFVLPDQSSLNDLDPQLLTELDERAITRLVSSSHPSPKTSTIVDFAILGPVFNNGAVTPSLLAYSHNGQWTYHSKDCADETCLGYDTQEEADRHNELDPTEVELGLDRTDQKCNNKETHDGDTFERWRIVKEKLRQKGETDHPLARVQLVVSQTDVMAEWDNAAYGYRFDDVDDKPSDRGTSASTSKPDERPNQNRGERAEPIVAHSGHSRRRRPQMYHPSRSTVVNMDTKTQEVALGHILIMMGAEEGAFTMVKSFKLGQRFHDHTETNTLCRGWVTQGDSSKSATELPPERVGEWYRYRCKPGEGYNFEPDFIDALAELYGSEKKQEPHEALAFNDSEAGKIAALFPGMVEATTEQLERLESTENQDPKPPEQLSKQESETGPQVGTASPGSAAGGGASLVAADPRLPMPAPGTLAQGEGVDHMDILWKRIAELKQRNRGSDSSMAGSATDI